MRIYRRANVTSTNCIDTLAQRVSYRECAESGNGPLDFSEIYGLALSKL